MKNHIATGEMSLRCRGDEEMIVQCIPNGLVSSNVYIAAQNGEGVVIDCGCPDDRIIDAINRSGLTVRHVILTHGHFDHIYYIDSLREKSEVKVYIHEADAANLSEPKLNGLARIPLDGRQTFSPADHLLKDGDIIECGGARFKIIHTPGHTLGGICILVENCLFTGDTLFKASIGRTDFPGGSDIEIEKSIREKLYTLPDETVVYPGHGGKTTIGYEKKHNPYIRE